MIELSKAIYQRATTDPTLAGYISGRFYKTRAPQNSLLPYVVYHVTPMVNSSTLTEGLDSGRIQFTVVSDASSSTEADNILDSLDALFDKAAFLTSTTGKVELMNRVTRFLDMIFTEDGAEEWNGVLDFEVLYQTY